MRHSAFVAAPGYLDPLEGRCTWLYLDELGLVTTGVGNLVDPFALALKLPWKRLDGTRATPTEIADAWNMVRSHQALRLAGGGAFRHLTTIRLTDDAVVDLVAAKLAEMNARMCTRYAEFEMWPADAQLGIVAGMAWAMGPGFEFPKFDEAARQRDWTRCASECHIVNARPARNAANMRCFLNAAAVEASGSDPDRLWWPNAAPWVSPAA